MALYIVSSMLSWCAEGLDLDFIIECIMCAEVCLWGVPQYGITLQKMLIFIASVLRTSDPTQHLNLLFVPTLDMRIQ